ncbi:hypothetical protein ACGFIY_29420 [Micromonospora chersina]|uniref:hypothetical protein n=1 Tax=Micromonospora chersina TaxID=47854 RepID=UPI00371CAC4C
MGRRSRSDDGQAWIAVEVRLPRWAVWCLAGGVLLAGLAAAAGMGTVLWVASR